MGWLLPLLSVLVIIGGWMYMFVRQNREHAANAPLRDEILERVSLSTRLDHVSKLGEGGFRGTLGMWIGFKGPKRLVVGADAFMISMPQALSQFVFTGRESSIAISQAPSGLAERDWIIITGQAGGRQIQVAITKKEGLPEIWQALAGTGAALVLRIQFRPAVSVPCRADDIWAPVTSSVLRWPVSACGGDSWTRSWCMSCRCCSATASGSTPPLVSRG